MEGKDILTKIINERILPRIIDHGEISDHKPFILICDWIRQYGKEFIYRIIFETMRTNPLYNDREFKNFFNLYYNTNYTYQKFFSETIFAAEMLVSVPAASHSKEEQKVVKQRKFRVKGFHDK